MELVQVNLAAAVGGGVRLDRDRDETELDERVGSLTRLRTPKPSACSRLRDSSGIEASKSCTA
jgi:hypothetical protein